MLTVYQWNVEDQKGKWLDPKELETQGEALRSSSDILWIDLDAPTIEEERLVLQQFFPIHFLSLEDVTRLRREPGAAPHFPKVEEFPDYLFVVVNPVQLGTVLATPQVKAGEGNFVSGVTQLSAILTHTVLITHHYSQLTAVAELREFLQRHETQAERGPDYLFHLILDSMVDQYGPLVDHIEDRLDEYETTVFTRPGRHLLTSLLGIKRSVSTLRKTLVYEREVLARLCRGEFELIDQREAIYYRNVYDHVIRFTELIETAREMVSDLMQTHLSATSNRMNEIMKVLTMISTTVLPMTLIAGVYGMNFAELFPSTDQSGGFWIALTMMASSGLGSYLFFKYKKWN